MPQIEIRARYESRDSTHHFYDMGILLDLERSVSEFTESFTKWEA